MRLNTRILWILGTSFFLLAVANPNTAATNEPGDDSRALVKTFAGQLQNALQAAMRDGGPLEAVSVCKERAPQIAAELSRQSGATVQRVSRRARNPSNAAQPWQIQVLEQFETDLAAGKSAPEFYRRHSDGGRYMKAIQIQPLCLVCHGESLAEELVVALDAAYPDDQARGYSLNDLRGAFSVVWPAPAAQGE